MNSAIQRRQTSRTRPRARKQIGIGHLTMYRHVHACRERGGDAVDVIGPELVPFQGGHRPQHGQCSGRSDRIRSKRGIRGQADKSELGQGAGRPAQRVFAVEPVVSDAVVHVRWPCEGQKKVEVEQERQRSSSCCLTRSRVRGGLLRETSNTGNPFRVRRGVACCCSPRRARSESTVPTERLRSPARDLAASRISSSMFRVVLTPPKLAG